MDFTEKKRKGTPRGVQKLSKVKKQKAMKRSGTVSSAIRAGRIEDKWMLLARNYFDKVSEATLVRAPNANNIIMTKMLPSLENLK